MDEIRIGQHLDKLRKRRDQVALTLRHIVKEQRQVEKNTDWLDQAAYERRTHLLDRLSHWYVTEINEIDRALARISRHEFGHCLACHLPIEIECLEISPETEFCSACQDLRGELARI